MYFNGQQPSSSFDYTQYKNNINLYRFGVILVVSVSFNNLLILKLLIMDRDGYNNNTLETCSSATSILTGKLI